MKDIINEEDQFTMWDSEISREKSLEMLEEKGLIVTDGEKISAAEGVSDRYMGAEMRTLVEWVKDDRDLDYTTYRYDILLKVLMELGYKEMHFQEFITLDFLIKRLQEKNGFDSKSQAQEMFDQASDLSDEELDEMIEMDIRELVEDVEEMMEDE